jgi:hypothetical protein
MAHPLLKPVVDSRSSTRVGKGSPAMSNREQLQTIDPAALAQVSGGAAAPASNNEQVLTALTGILESIQSLATQPSRGFSQQEMMLLMMMMQQRNQQQLAAVSGWSAWSQEPIVRYY